MAPDPRPTLLRIMSPIIMDEAYGSEPADLGIDSDDTEKAAAMRRIQLDLRGLSQVRHLHRCLLLNEGDA
jgi:hypothetical protein